MNQSQVKLFNEGTRTFDGIASSRESIYSFLNRSSWPDSEACRQYLESLFKRYPQDSQINLKRRIESEFESVYFEMFVFDLLAGTGANVLLHPEIAHETTRPDFKARFSDGREIVVEAVLATDVSDDERKLEARWSHMYEYLNDRLACPNYFVAFGNCTNREQLPAPSKLFRFIQGNIDQFTLLDTANNETLPLPTWTFSDENAFTIEISLIRKSREGRNHKSRPIGVFSGGSRWGGGEHALLNAVRAKAKKYGKLSSPFIVAVNALSKWGTDEEDVITTLYGRRSDGQLVGGLFSATRHTRLSAVLVCKSYAWKPYSHYLKVFHNPYASRSVRNLPWKLPEIALVDGTPQSLPQHSHI